MAKKNAIYDYRDYKKYLVDFIEKNKGRAKGTRSALAKAAGCQTAYVSQVLNGRAHFSLEQADAINGFCVHTEEEGEYFLLLVQHARAGTESLRKSLLGQIKRRVERQLNLKNRIGLEDALSEKDQMVYFSQWDYAAVHALLSVKGHRTAEALASTLRLSITRVTRILDFLTSKGLAARGDGGEYSIGTTRIHIGTDSPMITHHHTNWRLRAIHSLNRNLDDDTHYSSVVTVSADDAEKLRKMITDFILELKGVIRKTNPEGLHCINIDFFGFD